VTTNTYFLSNVFYLGVAFCGFIISWIWSYNVTKVALGIKRERFAYSLGAMTGSLIGLFVSQLIIW
jgi:hypothetical protein